MKLFNLLKKRDKQEGLIGFKQVMSEFNRSLSLFVDKDQLRANVIAKIKEIISVDDVYIFLVNPEQNRFSMENGQSGTSSFSFQAGDKLIFWLNVNETCLNIRQQPEVFQFLSKEEQQFLTSLNIELIYPLRVMNQTRGFVLLPVKNGHESYSHEETELLGNLLDQASFALENASLYKEQKDRLKKMYRTDRLAMMGQLAAGAAHEIRNPLTSIRSTIQYLKKDIQDQEKREMAEGLIMEVDRINEIIQGLLSFAKPSELELEMINLNELLEQSVKLITNTAAKKQIEINCRFLPEKTRIHADPGQLKQVFLNILINAIQAIENKGEIDIELVNNTSSSIYSSGRTAGASIIFKDNGKGIPPENQEKIFDPFFTTKQDGTGLGLSISYGIINKHGGDISIESTLGKGTKVIVKLPLKN